EVPEHAGVRFGYANIEHIEHLNKAMLSEEFTTAREGIYVYSCGSRRQMLGGFLNDELAYINQIAPTAGFITYGEFFHDMPAARTTCSTSRRPLSYFRKMRRPNR
ncbi:MAG: FIST C-terminal domain-containing protein, partial [Campylobacterales bacterium]